MRRNSKSGGKGKQRDAIHAHSSRRRKVEGPDLVAKLLERGHKRNMRNGHIHGFSLSSIPKFQRRRGRRNEKRRRFHTLNCAA